MLINALTTPFKPIFRNFNRQILTRFSSKLGSGDDIEDETEHFSFEAKHAVINGGASGIGLAIAREFLKRGLPCLTIIDIDVDKGEEVEEKLNREFGEDNKVQFFEADVANAKELDGAYTKAIHYYDIPEIVVNNAGIMNDTTWELQIQTNLRGCAIATLLSMQHMAKSSKGFGGTIVNIASIFGLTPSCGYPLHSMTQFGVCGFTKALGSGNHFDRTEVKIFALCAGLTETQLLSEAHKHAINDNFATEFLNEIEESKVQKADSVAKGLADIIGEAKRGSIWLLENDEKPYEIHFPVILPVQQKEGVDIVNNQQIIQEQTEYDKSTDSINLSDYNKRIIK